MMKEKTFNVKGMKSLACIMAISDSLNNVGVESIVSSYGKGKVTIRFDKSKINEEMIIRSIETKGYRIIRESDSINSEEFQ